MQKKLLFLILNVLFPLIVSCERDLLQDESPVAENSTKAIKFKSGEIIQNDEYLLKDEDLVFYSLYMNNDKTSPYGDLMNWLPYRKDGYITCYFVRFENGWQVLSADKRGPIVLAKGFDERYSFEDFIEDELFWLDKLSADIEFRWFCSEDYYKAITPEGEKAEESCMLIWSIIEKQDGVYDEKIIETKGGGDPYPLEPLGHYEITYSYNTEEVYEEVDHLLYTQWHQWNPYNSYCPYDDNTFIDKCPAGCVAIAGAQVLLYLHYFIGSPVTSPTSGYCAGYSHYNILGMQTGTWSSGFSDYSSSTWDYMLGSSSIGNEYKALLIGSIGVLSDIKYDEGGSGTTISKLVSQAFMNYGVTCTYTTAYNTTTVLDNLRNGNPVLIGGNKYENILSWPGHAWVIDGYSMTKTTIHYVHEWVYDDPEIDPNAYPSSVHIPYETTFTFPAAARWFKMNWGYVNYHNVYGPYDYNDIPFSTDGNWVDPKYGGNPYQYQIELAYGYSGVF